MLRGELMRQEAEKTEGAMAAVLKLSAGDVEGALGGARRLPGQLQLPRPGHRLGREGENAGLLRGGQGGGRARGAPQGQGRVPLPLHGGRRGRLPCGNSKRSASADQGTALLQQDRASYGWAFADALADQIKSPVRWQAAGRARRSQTASTRLSRSAPRTTLAGLIGKIDPGARVLGVEDAESLERAVDALC